LAVASAAVLAEFDRVRELVGDRPELLAYLYGAAAVRADDDRGRDAGLVVQADELRWAELEELLRLVEPEVAADGHPDGPARHVDCAAAAAVARVRDRAVRRHRPGPVTGT
jgi:hypothetical protein